MQSSRGYLLGPLAHSPIRVDDYTKGHTSLVYFSTHAHEDHLQGLHAGWRRGLIYATRTTRRLILLKITGLDPSVFAEDLVVDVPVLVPVGPGTTVCVTAVDARHCPGAVMLLFESKQFGRVLHTGDFRWELDVKLPEVLRNDPPVCVYLDNTFGLKSSPRFPARAVVLEEMILAMKRYPASMTFYIAMKGALGREEMLAEIGLALESKVLIGQDRWEKLEILDDFDPNLLSLFTTDDTLPCRVKCVSDPSFNIDENDKNVALFITTGWCGMRGFEELKKIKDIPIGALLPQIVRAPYTLHSSYEEIVRFVRECEFKCVVGTVFTSSEARDELEIDLCPWESIPNNSTWSKVDFNEIVPEDRPKQLVRPKCQLSPVSKAKRMLARQFRIGRSIPLDEDVVQVIFRRTESNWCPEEDEMALQMHQFRKQRNSQGHAELRKRLNHRSDNEIVMRRSLLTVQMTNAASTVTTATTTITTANGV